jgi:hypothetical protein|tara:strand:+ start:1546 stop:1908 length:363 start_codon:yes stop_codon:yes gene_type:complete
MAGSKIASSFLKKLKVKPTPVVPPEVLDKVSRKSLGAAKTTAKAKPSLRESMAMAKPDKKALAAARKANQPAGRTQKDRLREYMEAGGVNVPAGGFPDDNTLRMAMEKLKTPKGKNPPKK